MDRKKILLIDDEEDIRELLTYNLKKKDTASRRLTMAIRELSWPGR